MSGNAYSTYRNVKQSRSANAIDFRQFHLNNQNRVTIKTEEFGYMYISNGTKVEQAIL